MTKDLIGKDGPLLLSVAVIGGTGKEGSGLAKRWALGGYKVVIGSRDAERAAQHAAKLNQQLGGDYISGMENAEAAKQANLVVLSVPYSSKQPILESIKDELPGKILVSVIVPAEYPNLTTALVPEGKSAGQEIQDYLGDDVKVVSAFQNIGSAHLKDPRVSLDFDVLVCGDDNDAKQEVIKLVNAAGMRGLDGGCLANSVAVESLTAVLIHISMTYKSKGAGIRITNID